HASVRSTGWRRCRRAEGVGFSSANIGSDRFPPALARCEDRQEGTTMTVAAAIARILQEEGTEYLFCFPVSPLIDACASIGIRPIVARTERTLVNMADGYSRATNGRRLGVATVQHGPGAENAYAGVAQAFADGSPLLFLPGGNARGRDDLPPHFRAGEA